MTDRPSRKGMPLAERLPNARQERDEWVAREQRAADELQYATEGLARAVRPLALDLATARYSVLQAAYETWRAAASGLAQSNTLVAHYEARIAEESSDA